jgi:hypothetical protein
VARAVKSTKAACLVADSGTGSFVTDPRVADHALGIELQIEELVERRERARVQRRDKDAAALQRDIDALQLDLAETVELNMELPSPPPRVIDQKPTS